MRKLRQNKMYSQRPKNLEVSGVFGLCFWYNKEKSKMLKIFIGFLWEIMYNETVYVYFRRL